MWALVVILGIADIYNTDSMKFFHQNSNYNPVYEFVRALPYRVKMVYDHRAIVLCHLYSLIFETSE